MKTLVGSTALSHRLSLRPAKDVDYFSDEETDGENFYDPRLEQWDWGRVATLDELYTIKVSHIFWDLRNGTWEKHWADIIRMQPHAMWIPQLHHILYPIWEDRYGKKKVNLNAKPEDFFNKQVRRIYQHDSIHASVAYYDRPLFERVLKDGHEVMVDWNKFCMLSLDEKLKLVREEIYATALERQIIPSDYTMFYRVGYRWALKQTITSFWKGKWALWIALHAAELNQPDINFVNYHLENKHLLIKEEL